MALGGEGPPVIRHGSCDESAASLGARKRDAKGVQRDLLLDEKRALRAVECVAGDRMTDVGEVAADLVHATCLRTRFDQAVALTLRQHAQARKRADAAVVDGLDGERQVPFAERHAVAQCAGLVF